YQSVPSEMEFWRHMPTVWDQTRVIDGKIGEYASIARQSGDEWFIGTINNNSARELDVPLSFLDPSRKYNAHLYADDESIATPTHVRVSTMPVDSTTTLHVSLKPAGGEAVWIEPLKPAAATFKHPGILHTAQDMARMKQMVAEGKEPWKSGFEVLKAH